MRGRVGDSARVTRSAARRLIVALAIVTALFDLVILLPGNPYPGPPKEFVAVVLIQALVVWGLWRGSAVAWWLAIIFAVGQIVSGVLMAPGYEVGVVLWMLLSIALAGILLSYEVRWLVETGGRGASTERFTHPPSA